MRPTAVKRRADAARGLAESGYSRLPGFLGPRLVAALRYEVDRALDRPPVPGCERPHSELTPLRWNDRVVDLILRDQRRRRAVATATAGDDLRWISAYISVKRARTPPLWWHQDWWCWDHPVSLRPAVAQVAVLCYLSDTTPETGALRVLPGSHRRSVPLHATLPEAHARADDLSLDDGAFADQPGQVTLSARAGDAVVVDYRLLHGTHRNLSADRRDCVLLSFTPSWRDLPRGIRAHLVQSIALPTDAERPGPSSWLSELLPRFAGTPADLELKRDAPAVFAVGG
jgi:hypothetical protein